MSVECSNSYHEHTVENVAFILITTCNNCYHLHAVENAPISSSVKVLGVCLNLRTTALSQWTNYNFNSMCKFGNTCLGASKDGLFKLNIGDLDLDNEIDAYFKLSLTDFGIGNKKRIRKAYIGGEASGSLTLTLENAEGNSRDYIFTLPDEIQTTAKIAVGRDGKSTYWCAKVANINGCDFGVDTIELALVILNRK